MDINYHRNNYFLYPKELVKKHLVDEGLWGGWQTAEWSVHPANGYSYVSSMWVPRLAPLVRINHGGLEVGGFNLRTHLRRVGGGPVGKYYFKLHEHARQIQQKAEDLKGQCTPTGHPLPRGKREEWVEYAMWEMGMARSNYKPEVKDLFPHMNVGTVGHIDYGPAPFRQYVGRATYRDKTEGYRAYLCAFDPAKQEPTLAELFRRHS